MEALQANIKCDKGCPLVGLVIVNSGLALEVLSEILA